MATAKQREEFIARFVSEFAGSRRWPHQPAPKRSYTTEECTQAARSLLRHARTHNRLAEEQCNGPGEYITARMPYPQAGIEIEKWEAGLAVRQERVEKRLRDIAGEFKLPILLEGDPRGYTVQVLWPSAGPLTVGREPRWYGVPS